jgi:hypothetical protein
MLKRLVYPKLGSRQIMDSRRSDIVSLLDKIEDENGPVMGRPDARDHPQGHELAREPLG